MIVLAGCSAAALAQDALVAYRISQGGIPQRLTREPGDVQRGRATVLNRDAGCVLCHAVPGGDANTAGNIGPPLAGTGSRLSPARLRLRIVDSSRINRNSIMPGYYRTSGLNQVASAYRGKPILKEQQIEDIVAYLGTLR